MISFPLNVGLTIAFSLTGLYCLVHLLFSRARKAATLPGPLTDEEVVDITHVIMSVAMIAMTWVMIGDVLLWAQVALFVMLSMSLIVRMARSSDSVARVDLSGHVLLNVAMIWMLAAMPLLMAGPGHDVGSRGSAHGGLGAEGMEAPLAATPGWADVVNVGFVVASGVVAAWWLARVASKRSQHRWHQACHAVIAMAMAVMLVTMNA